ncbi:MAG: hypothetical protein CMP67_10700 [Flavobacteriales bacterium]|nr:hypothetical protein [Flavobacteriales bacterium]
MRFYLVTIFYFSSLFLFGQFSCQSPMFIKNKTTFVQNPEVESWFKFRAKGALLDFLGNYNQSDSLFEYQIYPFSDCKKIKSTLTMPVRSVLKNSKLVTSEIWKKVIDEGICSCPTCLNKVEINNNKSLQLTQGEFYLLRVLSHGEPYEFTLDFSEIDSLNPIQFSIDSVPIEEIEVGMVYQLKEIFFVPATPKYLDKSIPELKKLETFLKKHTVLKVQIRGHVNGPAQTKPSFYQSLSDERALAVKEFLVKNGVDAARVDAKGMSNFQMRYPSPKTAFEAEENRRVEIVIIAVE